MELTKVKYKQTEAGLIPEDWKIIRLSEALFKEQLPSGLYKDKSLYGSGTKIIKLGDVFAYDYYVPQFAQRVEISAEELNSYTIKVGDLIVALASVKLEGVGKVLLVDKLDEPTVFDHNVALIRLDKNYDSKYFGHIFKSNKIRNQVASNATQVGTTFLKASSLKKFNIPTPPTLTEQKAIATALSDVDDLITNLDKLISKKKDIKQGAMQQLLTPPHKGGKRLAGFTAEWVEKGLGEITHIKTGSKNNQDKVEDGEYPFFVRSQTVERINSYSYDCEAILIPGEGGIGSIYHYINGKFEVHQRVYKISDFKEGVLGKFIYLKLLFGFYNHAMTNSVKATVDSLRLPTFLEFIVDIPPTIEEQIAIAEILSDMDSEIEQLEFKKTKYQDLKKGMMQELLTGKTRLI